MANHRNRFKYARPRIQREFLSWFAESQHQFSTPIKISKHTKRFIELTFTDAQPLIRVILTSLEINVSFHWKGCFWDYLTCFEAIPVPKLGYYTCSLCEEPDADFYASREVLWQLHLFEPFLEWVNSQLTKAPFIEIYGHEGHTTIAKLIDSPEKLNQLNTYQNEDMLIIANPAYLKLK